MKKKIRIVSEFEIDTDGPGLPDEISAHVVAALIKRNTLHGWFSYLRESNKLVDLKLLLEEHKGLKNLICGFTENVKAEIMDS